MKKTFYILFIFSVGFINIKAQQDIHFSQFYSSPLFLNPASCGMFNGDLRATATYRTQWKTVTTPFNTITASADFKLFQNKIKNGWFGTGLTFYNDRAGDSKFTTGHYSLTLSYAIEVSENQYLTVGLQPAFMQRSINYGALYWDNQYTGNGFNQSLPSFESPNNQSFNTFDMGGGLYYLNRIDNKTSFYAGFAVSHINAADVSFIRNGDGIFRKYLLHGGAEIQLKGTNLTILPNTLVSFQGPNRIINLGADFKYTLQEQSQYTGFVNETSFSLGAYYRFGDALWATAMFNWTGLSIGFSYDLNISSFNVATKGMGGMEILLKYRAGVGHGKGRSTRFL